ncbi:succinate-semialdehyde dehydrogenase, mitochondrial [Selaginella moellendorffii]|uniref:succinate-semialdehyde dehydrogenase, mitochondrial n=1 Tax=Selaginella moellendorffii TaxID=88036 RepID=UPI000D1CE3FE|nr:succinate-semialdehyde dehydrogenase, mitochondrial [Selaginella moellendorffii]|eukprot:XP_024543141.1 succinate-semialdehyde dehydrogenase, mitochondrial [Selaginella moellendorffii]
MAHALDFVLRLHCRLYGSSSFGSVYVPGVGARAGGYQLQITGPQLLVTSYWLPVTNYSKWSALTLRANGGGIEGLGLQEAASGLQPPPPLLIVACDFAPATRFAKIDLPRSFISIKKLVSTNKNEVPEKRTENPKGNSEIPKYAYQCARFKRNYKLRKSLSPAKKAYELRNGFKARVSAKLMDQKSDDMAKEPIQGKLLKVYGGCVCMVKYSLITAIKKLKGGDHRQDDTSIRPMISRSSAATVEKSVNEAVKAGTKILVGGKQREAFMEPTILEDTPFDTDARKEEIFNPMILLYSYNDFKEAVKEANNTYYGLQASVFTYDLNKAGGVCLNNSPSTCVDSQPYGGIKDSGIQREGVKYTMDDMLETKVLVMCNIGNASYF